MTPSLKSVDVLRQGDPQGNRMVVRLTTEKDLIVHALGVPQDWPSRTGPTWTYLFEAEGLTLIDAGALGSFDELADGVRHAGFALGDIDRLIVTHGHADHDGASGRFLSETNAELWAHDIYAGLLPFDPWDLQSRPLSPVQTEMERVVDAGGESRRDSEGHIARHRRHVEARREFRVGRRVADGDRCGRMSFLHTPGHTPEELCVALDGLVFTGDHVLPEITPHPTMHLRYAPPVRDALPAAYRDEGETWGLGTYLRSLKRTYGLGDGTLVLPAHRLFNRGGFNFQTAARAGEIIAHHANRLDRILQRVGFGMSSLEELTRAIFARRKLIGGNLYAALSEVVAHIELLDDLGDLATTSDLELRRTGSENYRELVHELTGAQLGPAKGEV